MAELPGWTREDGVIAKLFGFRNYGQTIAFVNAVAWIARRENHHPELQVGFTTCRVSWTTHAIGGLSENDFICAAKVDALLAE
jgi:4a-hydroxytetrahydrobiopterin dehydratase